jgi:transcription elongation factor Elf1
VGQDRAAILKKAQIFDASYAALPEPKCPHCGAQMLFACRDRVDDEYELRVFQCARCGEEAQVLALIEAA